MPISVPKCAFPQISICPSHNMPICPKNIHLSQLCPGAYLPQVPTCSYVHFSWCSFSPSAYFPQCQSVSKCLLVFPQTVHFPKSTFIPVPNMPICPKIPICPKLPLCPNFALVLICPKSLFAFVPVFPDAHLPQTPIPSNAHLSQCLYRFPSAHFFKSTFVPVPNMPICIKNTHCSSMPICPGAYLPQVPTCSCVHFSWCPFSSRVQCPSVPKCPFPKISICPSPQHAHPR